MVTRVHLVLYVPSRSSKSSSSGSGAVSASTFGGACSFFAASSAMTYTNLLASGIPNGRCKDEREDITWYEGSR